MLTPEPGTVVGGKYRILRALGEGGMGAVYAAENLLTLKQAAIKWLHPRLVAVQEASQRLLYEARATARIRHRNVVDVYDVVLEQDSVFLVMELLLGEQLSTFLAREQLAVHEVVRLLLPAMRGVAAAHAAGVVHRDIKPDNILLVREPGSLDPTPKVIDFGISRIFEAGGARLTRSGMTMGTPRYVSYEQLRGLRDVDPRCDVYAFGVMLYEAVVGRAPYQASTFGEQAISFVTTVPSAPRELRPELPEPLDAVIRAAIAKEREERPASMEALITALEPFARAAAYSAPMPACRLELSVHPALANPAGTTAPLTATPVPSERARVRVVPERSPPAPARRWRKRALKLGAAGLSIGALLFMLDLGRSPSADGSAGHERAAAHERPGKGRSEQKRPPPESTDRPISPSDTPTAGSEPSTPWHGRSPQDVTTTTTPAVPVRVPSTPTTRPAVRSARLQSSSAPRAWSPVTVSGPSKVQRTPEPSDGAMVGGEVPLHEGPEPSRTPGGMDQQPHGPARDSVHRAGRLQRKEF